MTPEEYQVALGRFGGLVLLEDRREASALLHRLSAEALREIVAGVTYWVMQAGRNRFDLRHELQSYAEALQANERQDAARALYVVEDP